MLFLESFSLMTRIAIAGILERRNEFVVVLKYKADIVLKLFKEVEEVPTLWEEIGERQFMLPKGKAVFIYKAVLISAICVFIICIIRQVLVIMIWLVAQIILVSF